MSKRTALRSLRPSVSRIDTSEYANESTAMTKRRRKTLVRDAVAYELWGAMGHYGARTRYVELFVRQGTESRGGTNEHRVRPNGERIESVNDLPSRGANAPDTLSHFAPRNAAVGLSSLSSRRRREERLGVRRRLPDCPSLRLSPRSCLTGRERMARIPKPVRGSS
jgi:hypothetical protein